ncbi:hypothetical protein R80B4_02275 [Fibrobacteres bacterium R8-0-B4]
MVIDVRLVPEGHSVIEREAELSEYRGDLPPLLGPLLCRAELDRADAVIAVSLRFDGVFEVECARCLSPVGVAVGGDIRLALKEAPGRRGPALDGDDGADFFFDDTDSLVDLSPALYDEIMIALPMMPLCSEGCAGAWVASEPEAEGGEREIDPRWAGLLKLKGG